MSASNNPQVLIVGAGPTGLTAAAILAKLGIRVRIVDKNNARSDKSKALGVQAGTLECLEKAFQSSITKDMIAAGRPTQEAFIHIDDENPLQIDLSNIPSQHNYVLILAQSETERFLEEEAQKYSVVIERKTELISTEAHDEKIKSILKLPNGETEEVWSDFVIGCDGSHSVVRQALNITFEGNPYTGDFILGDVKIKWPWAYNAMRVFISKRGAIASFPLKGDHLYRLILIPKFKTPSSTSAEISADEFKNILATLSQNQIEVLESNWLTRFRVHHRLAHQFQKGRFFLAGDAAHIHSPAGGQGMNTGIQDALNLGFKLARVLHGKADLAELENYEKERLPVARAVLRGTDTVFRLALTSESTFFALLRRFVFPKVIGNRWLQRHVVTAISEVKVARGEIGRY